MKTFSYYIFILFTALAGICGGAVFFGHTNQLWIYFFSLLIAWPHYKEFRELKNRENGN